jgi:hypothetical protein
MYQLLFDAPFQDCIFYIFSLKAIIQHLFFRMGRHKVVTISYSLLDFLKSSHRLLWSRLKIPGYAGFFYANHALALPKQAHHDEIKRSVTGFVTPSLTFRKVVCRQTFRSGL